MGGVGTDWRFKLAHGFRRALLWHGAARVDRRTRTL
jgi:hypothetical protein